MENGKIKLIEDFKTLLKEMTLKFSEEKPSTPSTPEKFMISGKMPDGSEIMIEANQPEVGANVTITSPDGNTVPIMDGEYVLEIDGKQVKIMTVGGKISEVGEAAEEMKQPGAPKKPEDEKMGETETTSSSQMPKEVIKRIEEIHSFMTDKVTAMEKSISELTEKFTSVENENTELKKEIATKNDAFAKFKKEVETILDKPVEKSTHKPNETGFDRAKFQAENGIK